MTFIVLLLLLTQVSAHDLDGSVYCVENGEARRLSDSGAVTPIWTPDGRHIFKDIMITDGREGGGITANAVIRVTVATEKSFFPPGGQGLFGFVRLFFGR